MVQRFTFIILFSIYSLALSAQLDSIHDQGAYRTFITHLPAGYNTSTQYPIVIDMHGLNSNAAQQRLYSNFDATADEEGFIAVYPNAVNGSWELFTDKDVDFISHLIDTMHSRYSTNNCLFLTGMSDGGFMTYTLACRLEKTITAIAPVAGNMTIYLQNNCPNEGGIPVMHFHGTADNVVSYDGTFGIPPVENTIAFWVNKNETDTAPDSLAIPDTHPEDLSHVTRFTYDNGIDDSQVILYKVYNGGHTWPGAIPVPPLGNTNQDISASQLMGEFFKSYCDAASSVTDDWANIAIKIFPNPTHREVHVTGDNMIAEIEIFSIDGQKRISKKMDGNEVMLRLDNFPPGIYTLRITSNANQSAQLLIIN